MDTFQGDRADITAESKQLVGGRTAIERCFAVGAGDALMLAEDGRVAPSPLLLRREG